jgi:hypothetical protein
MNTAETILVIVTSSLLAISLLIGIVLLVLLVKLVATIRRIAKKADLIVDSAETAAEMFAKTAGPLSVLKVISNIVGTVQKHKQGSHK